MNRYVQMEFDFSDPEKPEETGDYVIEITRGWDGEETEMRTERTGITFSQASGVVAGLAKIYPGYCDVWTYTLAGGHTVVDFGSHFYFGRITPCQK